MFYLFLYTVSAWIAKSKTRVIDQIVDTMSYMRTGKFDRPMVIHSEDEFQEIATSYNQMLSKIEELMNDNQELGRMLYQNSSSWKQSLIRILFSILWS